MQQPIVIHAQRYDPAELQARENEERLRRCRPVDRSVFAVTDALAAIVEEHAHAVARLHTVKTEADRLLLAGAAGQVQMAREAVDLAEIEVQQFERMEAGMRVSLTRAQETEAAELRALAAEIPAAEALVAKWRDFIDKDYKKAATIIDNGLKTEAAVLAAQQTLIAAARRLPDRPAPDPLPNPPGVGIGGSTYSALVCLPPIRLPPPKLAPYSYGQR